MYTLENCGPGQYLFHNGNGRVAKSRPVTIEKTECVGLLMYSANPLSSLVECGFPSSPQ